MTDKIDFKKTLDGYQAQRGAFRVVDPPDARCALAWLQFVATGW